MEKTLSVISNPEILFTVRITLPQGDPLYCRLFRLAGFPFNQTAAGMLQRLKDVFFYRSPDNEFSVIASGQINISAGACGIIQNTDEFEAIRGHFDAAFAGQPVPAIPFLFTQRMFNKHNGDTLWDDYEARCYLYENVLYETGGNVFQLRISQDETGLVSGVANYALTPEMDKKRTKYKIDVEDGREQWIQQINKARDLIIQGTLSKVVLSRYINASADVFSLESFLSKMDIHPNTHRFVYKRGDSIFAGASPESLFTLRGSVLYTEALAGTCSRGGTPDEDALLADRLLNDPKELEEHRIVVDFIVNALKKHTEEIKYNHEPMIKKLHRLQHLWTPIVASGIKSSRLEAVISDLFPTPAICGFPAREAFKFIEETESYSRGLYSGLLGWYSINGDAAFFVPLRSALIKGSDLYVFCGGGIVKASDPELEFVETIKKAESILGLISE